MTDKYTEDQLVEGVADLNYDDGLSGLSYEQVMVLKAHLDSREVIEALALKRPTFNE